MPVTPNQEGSSKLPPPVPEALKEVQDAQLKYYQAQLDHWLSRHQSNYSIVLERTKTHLEYDHSARATEAGLRSAIHDAYIAIAKGALDRSLQRATFITAGSGTIGTIYASIIALSYSAGKSSAMLPARALLPDIFLGLALVLSSVYASFLGQRSRERDILPTGIGGKIDEERLVTFLNWVDDGVQERAWALRAAAAALGLGVTSLPIAFVHWSYPLLALALAIAAAIIVVAATGIPVRWRRHPGRPGADSGSF